MPCKSCWPLWWHLASLYSSLHSIHPGAWLFLKSTSSCFCTGCPLWPQRPSPLICWLLLLLRVPAQIYLITYSGNPSWISLTRVGSPLIIYHTIPSIFFRLSYTTQVVYDIFCMFAVGLFPESVSLIRAKTVSICIHSFIHSVFFEHQLHVRHQALGYKTKSLPLGNPCSGWVGKKNNDYVTW